MDEDDCLWPSCDGALHGSIFDLLGTVLSEDRIQRSPLECRFEGGPYLQPAFAHAAPGHGKRGSSIASGIELAGANLREHRAMTQRTFLHIKSAVAFLLVGVVAALQIEDVISNWSAILFWSGWLLGCAFTGIKLGAGQ